MFTVMKRYVILLFLLCFAAAVRAATPKPTPMYIVNGKEMKEIRSIPPEDIENVEMLPADEETIARYGQRAAHGVMLITLRYDQPAAFPADSTFGHYIASRCGGMRANPPPAWSCATKSPPRATPSSTRSSNRPTTASNDAC